MSPAVVQSNNLNEVNVLIEVKYWYCHPSYKKLCHNEWNNYEIEKCNYIN